MQNNRIETVLNQKQGLNVSDRYSAVNTQNMLDALGERGFSVTKTILTDPRKTEREGFQKHMIRLTHADLESQFKNVGDSRPELVIVNSHDASTSIRFLIGVYRLVCANGLIVGNTYGGVSIRHTGDVWSKIDKGLEDVTKRLPLVAETIQRFSSIQVNESKTLELTREAVKLIVPKNTLDVNLSSALKVRRGEDSSQDLWTVYNRIQESFLRGGVQYRSETRDENNVVSIRNNTSRAIKSIDRQVEVNRGLWDLVENFSNVA